ncbi:hypothetical protein DERF_003934 [Dermatophagoides farinae]|uniref:Uncharacterized protein n=1 Tax=Dermatophagoides farinae TaxID=6954 RepID=A0A922IGG4_DERFA|nr:hypothetical protein DERF_003934 [Dermatophagoides farinae]
MISRRRILSRSRDALNNSSTTTTSDDYTSFTQQQQQQDEDVWYNKTKLISKTKNRSNYSGKDYIQ